jgi:acyl-CoA synthetase (NDP forming)
MAGLINLEPLFRPRSVAVVGASPRPSVGRYIIDTLKAFGFPGDIYPVNPGYAAIDDRPCFASLADLPAPPDAVAFCVSPERTLDGFRQLPAAGARAAVIFGGGYGEAGAWGRAAQAEISGIARESGIALCGPNCMGVISPHACSATYLHVGSRREELAGNVGLISQSGSICISMLADVSRFGFSLVASTGNEAVVSAAAVLDYMVDHAETRIIATFTETIAEPERFVAALDRAAAAGKPVVVLKVGKTERTLKAITTHTGGIAGDQRVFSEVLRAHRAIEVQEYDELVEVLAAFQAPKLPQGRAISVVTSSGGAAELMLDIADKTDLALPALPRPDFAEARRVIGDFAGDGNPLDAWGNGNFRENMPHALAVVGRAGNTDAVVLAYDSADGAPMGRIADYLARIDMLEAARTASVKPHYQLTLRPGLRIAEQTTRFRALGIPQLFGVRQGLAAIDRLARWNGGLSAARPSAANAVDLSDIPIAGRASVHEHDSKRLIARLGLRTTRERMASSLQDAAQAAGNIGYPVVLKAVSDAIPHKSDLGLVILGIATPDELTEAWKSLTARLATAGKSAEILVQAMVEGGLEVFAGAAHHPGYGHVLAFGLGGVELELQDDAALRMLPLRQGEAEQMIAGIRGAARFTAFRGRPAYDTRSLAACLYAISDLITAAGHHIREIDLNPIKLMPAGGGCTIVDALLLPMEQAGDNA